jgi:hypothetical protein
MKKSKRRKKPMRESMQRVRRDAGFASLAVLLVVCVVLLILASIMLPSVVEANRAAAQNLAASSLNQLGIWNGIYSRAYGAFVSPQYLTGVLPSSTVPLGCANSYLLNPSQISAPAGYVMNFQGTASTSFVCPGVPAGYSAYSILLTPNSFEAGSRSFFMQQDGVIHFSDIASSLASASSPIYQITSVTAAGSVGGSGNGSSTATTSSLYTGIWSPSTQYTIGQFVIVPTSGNASPTLWENVTGLTTQGVPPASDPTDWLAINATIPSGWGLNANSSAASGYNASNVVLAPGANGCFRANDEGPAILPPAVWGCSFGVANTALASMTVTSFTVNFSTPTTTATTISFVDYQTGCNIYALLTAGVNSGGATGYCQINAGDTIVIAISNQGGTTTESFGSVVWSI